MTTQRADTIISGSYLIPDSRQKNVINNGAVAVSKDSIAAIGTSEDILAQFTTERHIHTDHGLIMPGLVNTHTHAPMACFRGLADDLPLMTWLEKHIFPVEARWTPEMIYHSTLLSLAEMIKSGTTSFCDMYLFSKEVARATVESGMRAWIGEVLYDFPSPCYGDLENGFSYVEELFGLYSGHSLISITADPHSVYTCSPELLTRLGKVAQSHDSLYAIHLSENEAEVNTCKERYNCSPVDHLERLGLLGPKTLAAHCVMLDDREIALMAERGVKVSHCQESNMKLASGTAPVVKMIEAGIEVGIGTDGAASNNDVDMFGEMNTVAKIHKVARMDPTAMGAEQTLHAATLGGATTLGASDHIGTLAVGKKADMIVLNMNQPHLTPLYNIPSHLVYAARGSDVIHSIINGRIVMEDRVLQSLDEEQILARMREIGQNIVRHGKD
ncbi:cytosine deaminase-like metal-dependent hydrolase [Desulfocapsa sulfexigens DSM 10523]|uniref:5-methylthioadenosine/S-adenosylhomocysteine deaminase n=1 Tax=Desulfocapsa sulfexigens (strain DSM 10523 / SB164P1) TaxID=1167006 RepID=M1NZD7_DESSD|nr:amidohydrolase [Desulfocapsa sulfexigens]AGF76613.1 cytosine deaminase-like metal-dependent hydrolase [Desulfocapsa sulfexigens DSM 10523]